jgi:hypothetical protein
LASSCRKRSTSAFCALRVSAGTLFDGDVQAMMPSKPMAHASSRINLLTQSLIIAVPFDDESTAEAAPAQRQLLIESQAAGAVF